MKHSNITLLAIILFAFILVPSCGNMQTMGLNSVELNSQLQPGMSYEEVEAILGKPKSYTHITPK